MKAPNRQHLAWMEAYDRARDNGEPLPPELLADPEARSMIEAWDRTHHLARTSSVVTSESRKAAAAVLDSIHREPTSAPWTHRAWWGAAAMAASLAVFLALPRAALSDPALVEHVESSIPGAGAMVLLDQESNTTLVWIVL